MFETIYRRYNYLQRDIWTWQIFLEENNQQVETETVKFPLSCLSSVDHHLWSLFNSNFNVIKTSFQFHLMLFSKYQTHLSVRFTWYLCFKNYIYLMKRKNEKSPGLNFWENPLLTKSFFMQKSFCLEKVLKQNLI